jgi:glycosyltransferase involved in cell wall biosynthesis
LPSGTTKIPRITVLLPTLNAEAYLADALDSLARQTFRDFKILVLDGGSTDRTVKLAEATSHTPLEVVHCGRIGLGAQLRLGLERVQTTLVARMDADDISLPERFARQVEALENSDAVIVGTQIELMIGARICKAGILPLTHKTIRRALLGGFPAFCHPSIMCRTSVARECGGYRLAGAGEDLDFYLRITEHGAGLNLPDPLHRYRLHAQSTSLLRYEEVERNYKYAVRCARARSSGVTEPTQEHYREMWASRSFVWRFLSWLECRGVTLYRASRTRLAEGNPLTGGLGAAVSVLLRPGLLRARLAIHWSALWKIERT